MLWLPTSNCYLSVFCLVCLPPTLTTSHTNVISRQQSCYREFCYLWIFVVPRSSFLTFLWPHDHFSSTTIRTNYRKTSNSNMQMTITFIFHNYAPHGMNPFHFWPFPCLPPQSVQNSKFAQKISHRLMCRLPWNLLTPWKKPYDLNDIISFTFDMFMSCQLQGRVHDVHLTMSQQVKSKSDGIFQYSCISETHLSFLMSD